MNETNNKLHIIISGERGKIFRLPCSKKKLLLWGGVSCFLLLGSGVLLIENAITAFEEKSQISIQQSNAATILQKEQQLKQLRETVAALKEENHRQRAQFEQEKDLLLTETMEELNAKSKLLEKLFHSIGIIVPQKAKIHLQKNESSGGLFHELSPLEGQKEELLNRIDSYLKKADAIPLGRPINGRITSSFGKRRDPFNGRISFHDGIDIKGRKGEKIYATAGGVVTIAGRKGGYGKYLELHHEDGYVTAYAHMHKILVKRGQRVKRGDVIGLVGNTGRSTGPHLHYEIRRNNKLLNPKKYVQVAANLKKHSR